MVNLKRVALALVIVLSTLLIPNALAETGGIEITIYPPEVRDAGAQWEPKIWWIGWGDSVNSGERVGSIEEGLTPVRFTDVTGWDTPSEIMVNVQAGKTVTASVTYEKQVASTDEPESIELDTESNDGDFYYTVILSHDVEKSKPFYPIDRADSFLSSDPTVYATIYTDSEQLIRAKFEWYKPNGNIYDEFIYDWSNESKRQLSWAFIDVKDNNPASNPGQWSVEISVDDGNGWEYQTTKYFTISSANNDSDDLPSQPQVDTELPTCEISGIKGTYTVGYNVSYIAKGWDNEALSKLHFAVTNTNKITLPNTDKEWPVNGTSANESWSFSTSGWSTGTYYYALWVKDSAGNDKECKGSFYLVEVKPIDNSSTKPPAVTDLTAGGLAQHHTPTDNLLKQKASGFLGINCPKGCSSEGKVGDPIDTATGAQLIEYTLLSVQGVLPISFSLSYNSLLLADGKAGKGWGLNSINARLEKISAETIKVHWSNNQFNEFTRNENGEYRSSALSARFDKLIQNADGSFTLTRPNKTSYEFSSAGQLTTLHNDRGQSLAVTIADDGQLTQITEPVAGVFLRYAYNAAGLLAMVTDSLERQVQLGYDDEQRLTTITDAKGQITTYTYNELGQVLTAVTTDGVTLFSNSYDEQGRVIAQDDGIEGNQVLKLVYDESQANQIITTVTDRIGKTRVYTYDDNYQLLSIQDELGNSVNYTYDANGNRTSVTDTNGNTTKFAYDANGNLTTITDVAGNVTPLTYDANDNLVSVANALGKTTNFAYDANHNLISTTDALGNGSQYAYNAAGQIVTVTNPSGAVTTYEYAQGLPIRVIDPEKNGQTLGYDAAGRLTTVTDADGNTTTLAYDAVNRLVKVTDALQRTVSMTYDSRGNLLTFTDAKGNVTKRSYDGNGNLISQTNALQQTTRYEYDGEDRLSKVIDAKNQVTQLHYDAKGRLISVTDPLNNTRQLTYDAADNVLSQIDALDKTVATFDYDVRYNLTSITDALQNTSELEYDSLSRLTQVSDPLKNVTQFNYDDVDRLVSSLDAEGSQSSQAFDNNSNLANLTDPNSNETGFKFDNNGRLVEEQSAAGGKVRYTYNARDLLVEVTNAREQSRQLEYDAVGRLIRLTDADGEITYSYDANDNVLTVTDANGKITREYDALDRVIKYTDSQANTLQYTYDEVGNLVTLTYPDNKQVLYEYNAAGQLIKVTDWAQRETQYAYDANGRLVKVQRPNGTMLTRSYDATGQLLHQQDIDNQGEIISQFDFSYDPAGDIIEEAMLPEPEAFPLQSVNMTYTAANRLATFNAEPVNFDADGNMTQGPLNGEMVDFEFDSRNRLASVGVMGYRYDAENQRVGVSVAGKETRYVINPQAVLSQVLVRTAPDGEKTFYVYGLGLIGHEDGDNYRAYHFDLRGSTVGLSDGDGKLIARFQYSPYGGLVSHSPVDVDTPFLFNGMYGVMTDATGLYYMRARYYNPEIRRFVNQDPLMLGVVGDGQSLNRYAYVTGEPVSFVDPFGLSRYSAGSCGSGWNERYVPEFNFTSSCQWHDECYGNAFLSKNSCDEGFYHMMQQTCKHSSEWHCQINTPLLYYCIVQMVGASAYNGNATNTIPVKPETRREMNRYNDGSISNWLTTDTDSGSIEAKIRVINSWFGGK